MAAMTWEARGLRRRDGSLAARPGTQGERNAEWARLYREEGLSFHAIARRANVGRSIVVETVTSFFTRQGVTGWRRCPGAC